MPRQSGKSTFMWYLLRDTFPNVLFINMEDPLFLTGFKSPFDLLPIVEKEHPFIKAIFIDKIQHIEEAGLFVKGLVNAKTAISIFVTGSSSFDLQSKTRESLAGKARRISLYPFSLQEISDNERLDGVPSMRTFIDRTVTNQLLYKSYPAVYNPFYHQVRGV